jgi:hypothetical protein
MDLPSKEESRKKSKRKESVALCALTSKGSAQECVLTLPLLASFRLPEQSLNALLASTSEQDRLILSTGCSWTAYFCVPNIDD